MKTILFEQLPPELFNLFAEMTAEIKELRRMIQEGEIGLAISEAEFNSVLNRITELETGLEALRADFTALNISPEQVLILLNSLEGLNAKVEGLESQDRNTANVITATQNRLTTIEMNYLNAGAKALNLPVTVTSDLTLPTEDASMNVITWSSSDEDYITNDGIVNRPTASVGNKQVVLTATITSGANSLEKQFTITVLALALSNVEQLNIVMNSINNSLFTGEFDGTFITVTDNQEMITELDGASISWQSSNEAIFSNDGAIVRSSTDENVTLTATVVYGDEMATAIFNIVVAAAEVPAIDYTALITSFDAEETSDGLKVTTVFGDLSDERLSDETVDAKLQVLNDIDEAAMIETTIKLEGITLGTKYLSGTELREGVLLSSLLGISPGLLLAEESHDTDIWEFSFAPVEFDMELSLEFLINELSVKQTSLTILGTPTEPEPEPTEPVDPEEQEPVEPEPQEPTEPETEPQEPTEEPVDPEVEPQEPGEEPIEPEEPETEPQEPVEETPTEPIDETPETEPAEETPPTEEVPVEEPVEEVIEEPKEESVEPSTEEPKDTKPTE